MENTKSLSHIHHFAIHVADITAGVKWYLEHFQCEVAYQDDSWAFLKFENIYLALVTPGQHPTHFAFVVDKPEQFGKTTIHRDGTCSSYIRDPFGNAIEMVNGVEDYE